MMCEAFPVIYSTLNTQAVVNLVLPHYDIQPVISCQFWHRGLSDIYWVTTATSPYILRVSHHHWRSQGEIEFELELLNFLQQHQIPVASPLFTAEGRLSVEINAPEGKRYAALFTYAPGAVALGDLNSSQSYTLGATLAKLHQVGLHFQTHSHRPSLNLEYLLDHSLEIIAPFLQHRQADLKDLLAITSQIRGNLQHFPTEPPFWGICWGDPHSGNAHFTADGKITLFDFDQCGYGWRAFDIAKFLQGSLRAGLCRRVREAFLTGYQSIWQLSEQEITSLQALTQTAHVWMWAISLHASTLFDYSRLDEIYFSQRLEQLKGLTSSSWQLF